MIQMFQNKQIIMYGDERYIRDFLYVFEEINPCCFVDDIENDFAKSYRSIEDFDFDEIIVIVCKYDELVAQQNLDSLGLVRGRHYVSASSLFEILDFPIRKIAKERRVYIWGTGHQSHHFFHEFVEKNPDIEVMGCIDSNESQKGKSFFRRPVYLPEEVLGDDKIFVIVATTRYWNQIKQLLLKKGKKEKVDFVHYTAINHWASWMMRETVYGVPRMDYVCPKAFHDAALMREGRLSVCSGIPGMTKWLTPVLYSDFQSAWHSNVMKVIRLSMINGTYSFCNTSKCNLLYGCGKQEIDVNEIHYELHRGEEELAYIRGKSGLKKTTILNRDNYNIKEPNYPDVVMCSYDRTCNLQCPSCRQELLTVNGDEKRILEEFTETLKAEVFPNISRLKVAGDGETFSSPIYRSILFDDSVAKYINRIGILSNGTLFTKEYFDGLADKYKEIHIFISMDGATKKTAEKLRKGADFDRWKANMEYLGKMRELGKISFFSFNFVVQRDNYLEMCDYVKMCLRFHADQIKFSRIFNWGKFSEEEFQNISMFDSLDRPKEELAGILKDDIFKRKEVKLFEWVDW